MVDGFLPGASRWLPGNWSEGGERWLAFHDQARDIRRRTGKGDPLSEAVRSAWERMQAAAGVRTGDLAPRPGPDEGEPGLLEKPANELTGGRLKPGGQSMLCAQIEKEAFTVLDNHFRTQVAYDDWRRIAWFNCDKFSTAWVTTLPDFWGRLDNNAVTYVCAAYWGLPQPMVQAPLGNKIQSKKGGTVCEYGIDLVRYRHPGPGWDRHHDSLNHHIADTSLMGGLFTLREVRGRLLAGLSPEQQAAANAERGPRGKKVQGQQVPDLLIGLAEGPMQACTERLLDVKTYHLTKSRPSENRCDVLRSS